MHEVGLREYYEVGTSKEGADAYPPLMLLYTESEFLPYPLIVNLLREYYEVGTSKEGADAYPPLMLLYTESEFLPYPLIVNLNL